MMHVFSNFSKLSAFVKTKQNFLRNFENTKKMSDYNYVYSLELHVKTLWA